MGKQKSLFKTKIGPGKPGSGNMFDEEFTYNDGPVTCLGMEFENDEARKEHFTELLRKKLKDPDFRTIEGFPIGEDKDILALSDPPYYTACPNPWIKDFIEQWESEKQRCENDEPYHREPFSADVKAGKSDPVYMAHTYHTKVPHKAIMRYILHYTEPGDIVFDGFCGTGMTGIAAQMCGNKKEVESLGYQVKDDGTILEQDIDENGDTIWVQFSMLGARKTVLNDLSPAASLISINYNTPIDLIKFETEAKNILSEIEDECGWMYETRDESGRIGRINYTFWSDVFVCPECIKEVVFWEAAVDKKAGKVHDKFPCPFCNSTLTKRNMERAWVTKYDSALNETIKIIKQVPVLIVYSIHGQKKRFEKKPDKEDLALIEQIENDSIPYWFPSERMMNGKETRRNDPFGLTHVHHFYTQRNLRALATCYDKLKKHKLKFLFTGFVGGATKLNQLHLKNYVFGGGGFNPGARKGTLYAPSISMEVPIISLYRDRLRTQLRAFKKCSEFNFDYTPVISTSSCDNKYLERSTNSKLDYIFIDPPFGANLNYSELSYIWEKWIKVATNNVPEAIENNIQKKGPLQYRQLMTNCFRTAYKLLKPGRWMTVEFSNTKANVWNNIQSALTEAGFVVANVSVLDKKQGGINANVNKTSVKQDLAISAYKPNGGFENRFELEAQTEEGVWDFIRTHLKYLPVIKKQGYNLVAIHERDPRILYDQVIAFFVRKGYQIPIDSRGFQQGLSQYFSERDGMYFLPEQVAEYDRKKMIGGGKPIQQSLFITDEVSSIEWLRNLLRDKPQNTQDITPQFMKEISGWSKNEVGIELSTLLEQNFLCYDGKEPVPEQIHSYLSTNWKDMRNLPKNDPELMMKAQSRWYVPDPNKVGDLEKLREKALFKEFEEYKQAKKKLKVFRLEAVRAGFKKAWQDKDYAVIVTVAEKIPNKILEEDPKLLMWYDQSVTRIGDGGGV